MCRESDSVLLLSTLLKEVSSLTHNMANYLLNITTYKRESYNFDTGTMAFNGLTNIHGWVMEQRAGGGGESKCISGHVDCNKCKLNGM